jgi:hypothetical protein
VVDLGVATLRQRPAAVEDIEPQLLEHFVAAREALLAGRPVVFEVSGVDLLGHGSAADAAVAFAMVGLARALALEGGRSGWSVNVVARDGGPAADVAFLAEHGLTDQLVHLDRGHLGRVRS